ncbi:MAG: hypothetical protein IT291_05440 [Deltaproteobacteria bacterium]|nr:hypothetical protein [Deltaproteobacteria bacterium]
MAKTLHSAQSPSLQLERAYQHVNDFWLPVNPQLLDHIHSNIKNGNYAEDCGELVKDLKNDFALFTYCLKQLAVVLQEEGVLAPKNVSPVDLLRWSGLTRLKKILEVKERDVSKHTLSNINNLQVYRLQEAMISASTAQMMSEFCGVDPELGFSAALLRQLGYTLICWNYPRIYQRAVSSLKVGTSLDLEITQLLGFSPQLLAMTIIRRWGIISDVCISLDSHSAEADLEVRQEAEAAGRTLEKICKVGEALARANQPEVYPEAQNDWEVARQEIQKALGEKAIEVIGEKIRENCRNYIKLAPDIFSAGTLLDPETRLANYWESYAHDKNCHIVHCRKELQQSFNEFYQRLETAGISEAQVRKLVLEIVPMAGFSGGCIYTIDPGLMLLVPQTIMGKLSVRDKAKSLNYSPYATGYDIVQLAYHSAEPIVHENILVCEKLFTCCAGVIGRSQRIGVLYLEMLQQVFEAVEKERLAHFRASIQALNDCLNLR